MAVFFISFQAFTNTGSNRIDFICGTKYIIEYINSVINIDREITLNHILKWEQTTELTDDELIELTTSLMNYRLFPINIDKKKCRYYKYLCSTSNKDISHTVYNFATKYLEKHPEGPKVCYIHSNGRENTYSIFSEECKEEIKKRIQTVPVSLVISQSGVESNWGNSYFAKEANNFFGIQTSFSSAQKVRDNAKCIPARNNQKNCVFKFELIDNSFFTYTQLLNSHRAYRSLRDMRYEAKFQQLESCEMAHKMAEGLKHYAKDPKYIKKIQQTITEVCQKINKCYNVNY